MLQPFIKPILIVIAVSMLVWVIFWTLFSTSKKKKGIKISWRAAWIFFIFYVYIIAVLSLTVFPLPFARFKIPGEGGINLTPVVNIIQGLINIFSKQENFPEHAFQNIFGNIILFIPLGFFLPLLSSKYRSLNKIIMSACICSASIELLQLVLRQFEIYRMVDIDDVILNTSGAILGFLLFERFYYN